MNVSRFMLCVAMLLAALAVRAQMTIVNPVQAAKAGAPQFQVDPFFPKPLPNNWLLGQVSGLRVDKQGNLWEIGRAHV